MALSAPKTRTNTGRTAGASVTAGQYDVIVGTAPTYAAASGNMVVAVSTAVTGSTTTGIRDNAQGDTKFAQLTFDFYLTDLPTAGIEIAQIRNASAKISNVVIGNDAGTPWIKARGGADANLTGWTTNTNIALNTWYRIKVTVQAATSTTGKTKATLIRLSDSTTLASGESTNLNNGTANVSFCVVGKASGTGTVGFYFDNTAWWDSAYAYIDPARDPIAATATAHASGSGATASTRPHTGTAGAIAALATGTTQTARSTSGASPAVASGSAAQARAAVLAASAVAQATAAGSYAHRAVSAAGAQALATASAVVSAATLAVTTGTAAATATASAVAHKVASLTGTGLARALASAVVAREEPDRFTTGTATASASASYDLATLREALETAVARATARYTLLRSTSIETRLFVPPGRLEKRKDAPSRRDRPHTGHSSLWGHMSVMRGVSILKENGLYRQVDEPTPAEISAAQVAYIGGHEYMVSLEEAEALEDAGYGSWVISSGFGSGLFGAGPFGGSALPDDDGAFGAGFFSSGEFGR